MATTYEIINVNELWLANHSCADGEPLIKVQQMCEDGGHIDIPELSYGCNAAESDSYIEGPGQDTCVPGPYALPAPTIYFIKDCIIWSKYGLVTVGKYMLKETTFIFPNHLIPEVNFEGEQFYEKYATLEFPPENFLRVENAMSILSGFDENYFHYLIMFLTKFDPSVFYAPQWDTKKPTPFVIAPNPLAAYQAESVARFCKLFSAPCIKLEEKACIRVQNLALPIVLGFGGMFPHPLIKRPLGVLEKSFMGRRASNNNRSRKLYVSRRDSNNRSSRNMASR